MEERYDGLAAFDEWMNPDPMTATDPARTVAEVVGETLGCCATWGWEPIGAKGWIGRCGCGELVSRPTSGTVVVADIEDAHRDHQAQAVAAALRDAGWVK